MRTKPQIIAVKLTDSEKQQLMDIARQHTQNNVSEAIRRLIAQGLAA